jgi:hypothetical protein
VCRSRRRSHEAFVIEGHDAYLLTMRDATGLGMFIDAVRLIESRNKMSRRRAGAVVRNVVTHPEGVPSKRQGRWLSARTC